MGFDYDAIQLKKHSSGTQWASYSDLFMVLAFVFLLLYLVSSLRTGMASVTANAKIKQAQQELDLYESIRTQYLAEQASAEEKQIYQDVLNRISLLQDEAAQKQARLQQQYNE